MAMTQEELQKLVVKAVLDRAFRNALIADAKAAACTEGIQLDDVDVDELSQITDDLQRFGGTPGLALDDVKGWSVGICQIRTVHVAAE